MRMGIYRSAYTGEQIDALLSTSEAAAAADGILKGDGGGGVAAAIPGVDYAAANHAHGGVTNDGRIGEAANRAVYTGAGGALQAGLLPVAAGGTGAADAAGARANLGAAETSHTHGNVTNDGKIGATAGLVVVTAANGVLATGMSVASLQGLGTPISATSGTITVTMDGSYKTITPTGACTFNASGGVPGQRCAFIITTSGTTSYTLTWSTNFKATGTLATGTVSGKKFVVEFIYDGTLWCECSRTAAM